MTLLENEEYCLQSLKPNAQPLIQPTLVRLLAGLASEAGEVTGLYARFLQGREVTDREWLEELGDVFWYLSNVTNYLGYTLQDIANYNYLKLEKRYPTCQEK